jgi:hypothetical protein
MGTINFTGLVRSRVFISALVLTISFLAPPSVNAESLRPGLYRVTSRVCQNQKDLPDDCPRIQYIELVKGIFHGVLPDQIALVIWLASEPAAENYTYNARRLRGRFVKPGEYVIDETSRGKEWITENANVICEYWYVGFDNDARKTEIKRTHLTLQPVSRDDRINRRLEYPEPE